MAQQDYPAPPSETRPALTRETASSPAGATGDRPGLPSAALPPAPPWDSRSRRWLSFFRDAGVRVEILLGADVVVLSGPHSAALTGKASDAARDLCALARHLLTRDSNKFSDADRALGLCYSASDGTGLRIRQATLEEQVAAHVDRLRSSRGTALRRVEADAIADLIEGLAQRAAQPCRGRRA